MRLKKESSEQKLRGAYYTPLQLADAMVELFASQNISTVLEPSCGDGVFLDALQNLDLLNKVDKLTAVEIEPDEAEKVRDIQLSTKSTFCWAKQTANTKAINAPSGIDGILFLLCGFRTPFSCEEIISILSSC